MPYKILVTGENDPLNTRDFHPVPGAPLVVGREEGVDCVLPGDSKVSRRHCQFEISPDGAILRDLGSTNGLRVNEVAYGGRGGRRNPDGSVPPAPLNHGDRIRIGSYTLLWQSIAGATVQGGTASPPIGPADNDGGDPDMEPLCAHCGAPARSASAVLDGGRILCMSCRLTGDGPASAPAPAGGDGQALPQIDGYEITRVLGEGGLGRVYHAWRRADDAEVAIKVLLVKQAATTADLLLFKRETEIMRSLKHENIVAFHEAGQTGAYPFVVMEYMPGGTLSQLIRLRGTIPVAEALPLIRQMLAALSAAHGRGIIHRDIKPLNILLDKAKKTPKLMDFGLAKSFLAAGMSGFTKTGTSFGSLNYLPPEQLHDYKRLTPAADVFAMGAVIYEMLSGQSPYTVKDGDYMGAVLAHDLTPLAARCPRLPPALAGLVDRALSRESTDRYQDAGEMLAAFSQFSQV